VVGYIVRSLHGLLKTEFGKRDGLASDGVTLLDPAAGTMTFVARAAQQAVAEFEAKYGSDGREDFIRRHVLKNFYAFELMMAPYAVGHLKMSFFLEELGHRLTDEERIPFYLTNTLDNEELEQSRLPGFSALAEESRLAGAVKKQTPIIVILGNPPYSGHSSNTGDWIRGLIDDYKQVDGKPLGEKTSKWLQDDYVKFLRFAQWKIEQAGCGVVGMITNHSYLDNLTFRGMRQSLMRTFDEIYILDLHGNSLKKETCPDDSPDKNVFDIRQGVAIAFFIKCGGKQEGDTAVHHADLWGLREAKYAWLDAHDLKHTDWRDVKPASPFYLFVPRDDAGSERYQEFMTVTEVFPLNGVGMTTARDEFVIDTQKSSLINRVCLFKHNKGFDDELHRYFSIRRKKGWSIRRAWNMLQELTDTQLTEHVVPVLYRPFDVRWMFYHDSVVWRTAKRVMRHMLAGENVALLVSRQVVSDFRHTFVTDKVTNFNNIDTAGRFGSGYQFPLYLYPSANRGDLFAHHEPAERQPNLNPSLVSALTEAYGKKPAPEEIFHYVYAVLYAPTYRTKYAEFLRMDFPRVPFTADAKLFQKLAALGARLTALHLLTSPELDPPACRFEGEGDSRIGKGRKAGFRYEPGEQRAYINATQYFAPVAEAVWSYQVGGYQVCEKWLKDRQERRLEFDDIRTYCHIVTALGRTLVIQTETDALYPGVEKSVVAIPGHTAEVESGSPTIGSTRRRTRRA
jgi:predicted helicase